MIALREPRAALPAAAAAVALGLALWALVASFGLLAAGFFSTLWLLAHLVFFVDGVDLLLRLGALGRRRLAAPPHTVREASLPLAASALTPYQKSVHLKPWAMLLSVHDAEPRLDDFIDAFEPYRDRVYLIDDASSDDTRRRLVSAGFRCVDGGRNRKKPGAIRRLLAEVPAEVATVLILDPDTVIRESGRSRLSDLETVIFDFQRSGHAALCPRVTVREDGILARLQGYEYALGCVFGRRCLGGTAINSGVSIYRRTALEWLLERHSLSVYAEDLENSMLLLGAGETIYFDGRLVVETEAKRTWRGWFSQRVGWAFGLIRVYAERFGDVRRVGRRGAMAAYQFLVYFGLFSLLFHPFRILSVAVLSFALLGGILGLFGLDPLPGSELTEPSLFLSVYSKYLGLTLAGLLAAVQRRDRWRLVPILPLYLFYAMAMAVPQTLGYANWLSLRLGRRRLFPDHYEDEGSLGRRYGNGGEES